MATHHAYSRHARDLGDLSSRLTSAALMTELAAAATDMLAPVAKQHGRTMKWDTSTFLVRPYGNNGLIGAEDSNIPPDTPFFGVMRFALSAPTHAAKPAPVWHGIIHLDNLISSHAYQVAFTTDTLIDIDKIYQHHSAHNLRDLMASAKRSHHPLNTPMRRALAPTAQLLHRILGS